MSSSKSASPTTFFGSIPLGLPLLKICWPTMVLTKDEPLNGLFEAKGIIGDEETSNLGHLGSPPLLQTVASKAIGVQYPRCL